MGLFDKIARDISGTSNKRNYSSFSSSSSRSQSRPEKTYQCKYCGMRRQTFDPQRLPHGGTGCPARGKDNLGRPLDHIWREM